MELTVHPPTHSRKPPHQKQQLVIMDPASDTATNWVNHRLFVPIEARLGSLFERLGTQAQGIGDDISNLQSVLQTVTNDYGKVVSWGAAHRRGRRPQRHHEDYSTQTMRGAKPRSLGPRW